MIPKPIKTRPLLRLLSRSSTFWTKRRIESKLALLPRPTWHTIFIESREYEGTARGVKISLFSLAFSSHACWGAWGVGSLDGRWFTGRFSKLDVGGSAWLGQRNIHWQCNVGQLVRRSGDEPVCRAEEHSKLGMYLDLIARGMKKRQRKEHLYNTMIA